MNIKDMFDISYDNDYFDEDDFGEDIDGNKVASIVSSIRMLGDTTITLNKEYFKRAAKQYPLVAATIGVSD